jgi:hypothetical protein
MDLAKLDLVFLANFARQAAVGLPGDDELPPS